MTEIITGLHQIGAHELDSIPSVELIIDVGGIINRAFVNYWVDDRVDEFKRGLNVPVLTFELDEVSDSPFRDFDERKNNLLNLVVIGTNFLNGGAEVCTMCLAGQNRSGLVNALIMCHMGFPPERAIDVIRSKRDNALNNQQIVDWILSEEWK